MRLPVASARAFATAFSVLALAAPSPAQAKRAADPGRDDRLPGHSARGHAFDQGPREKPWKMDGIGAAHFPITTSVPEVQQWFDQGIALLHSFQYYEAERAFRWCVELDPECAMAYWGMALAADGDGDRFEELLSEAQRRKGAVSERERLYIEAWVGARAPRLEGRFRTGEGSGEQGENELLERLEALVLRYPDDVEAKLFCVLASMGAGGRVAYESLLQDVLASEPEHPGAHHYRIHLWDNSEHDGAALSSCAKYGRIAWDVGHANHMPGHVYSGVGMWREAALWMESATRIELRQMQGRMLFPYDYWNFAHNRNYLCYIQEQQGLVEQALLGARTLLASPTRPPEPADDGEKKEGEPQPDYVQSEGMSALVRCLIKFERWEDVLREDAIPWDETDEHEAWRAYAEALAHLGLGDLPKALERAAELDELARETKEEWRKAQAERWFREVDALIRLRTDRELEALSELERLAREQAEDFRRRDDPPDDRTLFHTLLGELYLERESPRLAAECFEKSLELVRNDGFALSGLARARAALGDSAAAARAYGRLRHVWQHADAGLRWMEAARALGLESDRIDESPEKQRDYHSESLAKLGPLSWEPFAAPTLSAVAPGGERVTLESLRGKNVVLVFYLGGQCVHCVDELAALAKRASDFAALDATILAVSPDAPADLAKPAALAGLDLRLLSDPAHESARAFRAWDDFEDQAVHATVLVDRDGRVRWKHVGAKPFSDAQFLLDELERWGKVELASAAGGAARARGKD